MHLYRFFTKFSFHQLPGRYKTGTFMHVCHSTFLETALLLSNSSYGPLTFS